MQNDKTLNRKQSSKTAHKRLQFYIIACKRFVHYRTLLEYTENDSVKFRLAF
jgi:hypothetical protein